MVSIIVLIERAPAPVVDQIIDNISKQTYEGDIEVILGMSNDYPEVELDNILQKYAHKFTFKYVHADGIDIISKCRDLCDGEFIFYKTIGNQNFIPLWYSRHIEVALSNLSPVEYYGYSMIDYRNIEMQHMPFHKLYWRPDNFKKSIPNKELVILDEVWHRHNKSDEVDYNKLLAQDNNLDILKFNIIFKSKRLKPSSEYTVTVYINPQILSTLLGKNNNNGAQPVGNNSAPAPVLNDDEILL